MFKKEREKRENRLWGNANDDWNPKGDDLWCSSHQRLKGTLEKFWTKRWGVAEPNRTCKQFPVLISKGDRTVSLIIQGNSVQFMHRLKGTKTHPMRKAGPQEDGQAGIAPTKHQLGHLPLQEATGESLMHNPFKLIASKDVTFLYRIWAR